MEKEIILSQILPGTKHAAYAEFRGKSLPTVYQWEKAARNGVINYQGMSLPWGVVYSMDNVNGRANFNGKGTEPVNKYEFGISAFGCYNMAGNVKEWCLNNSSNGYFNHRRFVGRYLLRLWRIWFLSRIFIARVHWDFAVLKT